MVVYIIKKLTILYIMPNSKLFSRMEPMIHEGRAKMKAFVIVFIRVEYLTVNL